MTTGLVNMHIDRSIANLESKGTINNGLARMLKKVRTSKGDDWI